jgi:hypothetical protein
MLASRRLPLFAALLALAPAGRAFAYEDSIELAASVGYAGRLDGDGELGLPNHGMSFAGTVGFGLNDAWSLRVTGMNQLFVPEPRLRRSALLFEATYALDVVRVVPVLGAGVGAALEGMGGAREVAPAASVFLSLDVLLTRSLLIGPEVRLLYLPFGGFDETGDFTLSASVRLAYLWDRF